MVSWSRVVRTIPSRVEGCEAYDTAGIECPIGKWLEGQKGVSQHIVSAAALESDTRVASHPDY